MSILSWIIAILTAVFGFFTMDTCPEPPLIDDPYVAYKPVIYLYPEEEQNVEVSLELNGAFTCTYPSYQDGWQVTAAPDGTLTDKSGMEYRYLYWEADLAADWDFSKGFCIPGNETASFLETSLADLGLTRAEANEFIIFWLPQMQDSAYNLISFQTEAYTDAAKLTVSPEPDTLIRIFMTWTPVSEMEEIEPQELAAASRTGFTVVEWGGTKIENR